MIFETLQLDFPVGPVVLVAKEDSLVGLCFEGLWERRRIALEKRFPDCRFRGGLDPAGAASRLREYFGGNLGALATIKVETFGTPFQQKVWQQLRAIPVGETRNYAELAVAVGKPRAVRAVGAANGANPVGIVVPCHRVIGSDGKLTGFAGGLANKRWLLDHEDARPGIAGLQPAPGLAAA